MLLYYSITVWDLSNSDLNPTHKISTKSWGGVKCIKLSSCNTNRDMLNQYLVSCQQLMNILILVIKFLTV